MPTIPPEYFSAATTTPTNKSLFHFLLETGINLIVNTTAGHLKEKTKDESPERAGSRLGYGMMMLIIAIMAIAVKMGLLRILFKLFKWDLQNDPFKNSKEITLLSKLIFFNF